MKNVLASICLFAFALFLVAEPTVLVAREVQAPVALKLAAPIGDHMVLQQGKATSIWGMAPAGSEVTVSFAGQTIEATANEKGEWIAKLSPLKQNAAAQALTVKAVGETLAVEDILVGEVWMCSGQSNMAWTLNKTDDAETAVAAADHPKIRLFTTSKQTAAAPQRDCVGEWQFCTPETAPNFSAVGYHFGRELREALGPDTPIGLVCTAWGGKPSEAFTSRAKLETVPAAKRLLEGWDARQSAYDEVAAKAAFEKALAKWEAAVKKIREGAKAAGRKPGRLPRRPLEPMAPQLDSNFPASISNQNIEPWTNYAIAGAIWYQGESNQWRAKQYGEIFPAMIEDWRERWGDELPFYFVQLANFQAPSTEPGVPNQWAELQESQRLTLERVPKTGMAIINDIGEASNIHPKNKRDVGKRLALWALAKDYGKAIDPISGPLYRERKVEGDKVRVFFDHVGGGLKSCDGGKLARFEIAGKDQKFVWAEAEIAPDGKSVIVSSPEVKAPASVRYAWAANPEGANLVNSAGLPASLFRTDDWKLLTDGVETKADDEARRRLAGIGKVHAKLEEGGWTILFNARDLDNWMNPYDYGKVAIVGDEIHLEAEKKFFLCTREKFGDFMLVGEVHLPEGKANSGFMFRCHVEPGKVYGYQAEVDGSDRCWSGGLYDEGRRKWLWPSKEGNTQEERYLDHAEESQAHFAKPEVKNALKRNDWNKYMITCKGDRITIKVNGVTTTNFRDDMDAEGHIGIQHHGEKGAVYRFRNLYLKKL